MANESYYEKRKRVLKEQKKRQESRKMTGGLGDANASANTIQKAKVRLKDSMKQPKKDAKKVDKPKVVNKTKTKKTVSDKMKTMYSKNIKDKLDKKVKEEVSKANKSPTTIARKAEKTYNDTKKKASDKVGKTKKYSALDNSMSEKFSKTMSKIKKDSEKNKKKSVKKPKKIIVTKEQLRKSGLTLRDYMNMLLGKTRRDYKDVKKAAQKKRAKRSST